MKIHHFIDNYENLRDSFNRKTLDNRYKLKYTNTMRVLKLKMKKLEDQNLTNSEEDELEELLKYVNKPRKLTKENHESMIQTFLHNNIKYKFVISRILQKEFNYMNNIIIRNKLNEIGANIQLDLISEEQLKNNISDRFLNIFNTDENITIKNQKKIFSLFHDKEEMIGKFSNLFDYHNPIPVYLTYKNIYNDIIKKLKDLSDKDKDKDESKLNQLKILILEISVIIQKKY